MGKNKKFIVERLRNALKEGYDDVPLEYIKNKKRLSDYSSFDNKIIIDGNTYLMFLEKSNDWFLWGEILVFDNQDQTEIAKSSFGKELKTSILKASIDVRGDKRRTKIGSNIYVWIEKLTGEKLTPDTPHSKSAEAFWNNPNKKFG